MKLGDKQYKRRVPDDPLTMEIFALIRQARAEKKKATFSYILSRKVPKEYAAVNNMRGKLSVRVRKLVNQGRLKKVETEEGVVLKVARPA